MSFKFELRDRILETYYNENRPTGIIYLGDFDPSGMDMLPAMEQTLWEEMGLPEDAFGTRRCALNFEHVEEYQLPHSPDAVKFGDSRARAFVERYGEVAVELDALEPATFMAVLDQCIQDNLDMPEFEKQAALHQDDAEHLDGVRETALLAIG